VLRIVILGRGASGKSTLARALGARTGLPVVELDDVFWQHGVMPTPAHVWVRTQRALTSSDRWILDGDLGRYDDVSVRLAAADTVVVLDFSLVRCAWSAIRRSRERSDFWWWLVSWRWTSRPALRRAIAEHAPNAKVHVLRGPRDIRRLLAGAGGRDVAR
jgi:hypothetical protein